MSTRQTTAARDTESTLVSRNRSWSIFLISVLGLFLEMLLIRWIGTEIRIFAYLQNTVLVVCFLGLGMGCFTCRQRLSIRESLIPLLCLTTLLAIPFTRTALAHISKLLSVLNDLVIWDKGLSEGFGQTVLSVTLGLVLTFFLMLLLFEVFVPLGRILGRLMDESSNTIWAYSVNVAGSLVGIWLFVVLSVAYMPPVVWFVVSGGLLLWFFGSGRERFINLAVLAAIIATAWVAGRDPAALDVAWSPYQKLAISEFDDADYAWTGKLLIAVNNAGYQGIIDLSEKHLLQEPRIEAERRGLSQYDIPLLFHKQPDKVLIVGAGSGNDVAGALRGGAKHVTAVEIDPTIIEMGRRFHPEQPYDAPQVTVVNDDARSFFASTSEKFDLIIFGLLDSHTTTAMTNARLDHYVYTRESIARARSLLAAGGVLALSFEAQKSFIADRMASCLAQVFGHSPLVFRVPSDASGWGGVMFVAGDDAAIHARLAENKRLANYVEQWQHKYPIHLRYSTAVTTDDWPYIYLRGRSIPTLYYLLVALMIGLVLYCSRRPEMRQSVLEWNMSHWHFFFLGAAFLLLEVQNISKASVVLGNTWCVNAVIISGILVMILLANLIDAKFRRIPELVTFVGLVGSCCALYFFDISQLGFLPFATKAIAVGALTTLPMLFSGLIFIRSFARVDRKDLALGANLIGSLAGGLLQSVTFLTGVKALLLIVAALYIVALMTRPRRNEPKTRRYPPEPQKKSQPAPIPAPIQVPQASDAELLEPVGV